MEPLEPYDVARRRAIDTFEQTYLAKLLEHSHGNIAAASRDAGVNRSYLYRMLRRHGMR